MAKLRAGTPVLVKARVHRQTTAADQGIDSIVVWVTNPLSTTRSDRELSLTLAPDDVVVPEESSGTDHDVERLVGLLTKLVGADTFATPPDLTDDEVALLDHIAGLQPTPADG